MISYLLPLKQLTKEFSKAFYSDFLSRISNLMYELSKSLKRALLFLSSTRLFDLSLSGKNGSFKSGEDKSLSSHSLTVLPRKGTSLGVLFTSYL